MSFIVSRVCDSYRNVTVVRRENGVVAGILSIRREETMPEHGVHAVSSAHLRLGLRLLQVSLGILGNVARRSFCHLVMFVAVLVVVG